MSGVKMGMVVEYSNNDIEKPSDTSLVRSLLKYVSNSQISKGTRIKVSYFWLLKLRSEDRNMPELFVFIFNLVR